jgi:hypothetical protein
MWAPAGSGGARIHQSRRAKQQEQPLEDIGYLIDLDFAADIGRVSDVKEISIDGVSHTLALPFLAIDHLPEDDVEEQSLHDQFKPMGLHFYRHDLESFFWSTWWIILGAHPATGAETLRRFAFWNSPDMGVNRDAKIGFLRGGYKRWSEVISKQLWQGHHHRDLMVMFLNKMSIMFFQGYRALEAGGDSLTAGGWITLENFLQLFPIDVGNSEVL